MKRYVTTTTTDIDELLDELEMIANMTSGAHETVVYMKDSVTSAQKSSLQGNTLSFHKISFYYYTTDISLFLAFSEPLCMQVSWDNVCCKLPLQKKFFRFIIMNILWTIVVIYFRFLCEAHVYKSIILLNSFEFAWLKKKLLIYIWWMFSKSMFKIIFQMDNIKRHQACWKTLFGLKRLSSHKNNKYSK